MLKYLKEGWLVIAISLVFGAVVPARLAPRYTLKPVSLSELSFQVIFPPA